MIRPKLDELFAYLDEKIQLVLEKSELYKAIQYARTNKKELYTFLEDSRLELSNNLAERSQKAVIIGRKNSMFLGSTRGAQSSAMIYSLVPIRHLNYLLEELAQMEKQNYNMEQLMPWSEAVQGVCRSEVESKAEISFDFCLVVYFE